MTMLTKTEAAIITVGLIAAFAFGRYSAQQTPAKTEVVTTDVKENQNVDDKKKTTTTETKKPDGTVTTVTTVDEDTTTKTNETEDSITKTQVTPPKASKLNVSVLGANDFSRGLLAPAYGLSVSKEVLGPVTVGVFGMMNGVVGISVGLDF